MADTIRVGVFGPAGRMGSEVCRAVVGANGVELVAAVDPHRDGVDLRQATGIDSRLQIGGPNTTLKDARAQVAVDFSPAAAVREHIAWCAENGIDLIVGTSGLTPDDVAAAARTFERSGGRCIIAANFAIGAVLMMRFAEMAAPWFESAEIVEIHHDRKVDSPSGTAIRTAERMSEASGDWAEDPTEKVVYDGARGARGPGGIPIHSLRVRGAVAHQEVVFGTQGQGLTIRHDSFDRTSFMPGVLLAIRGIGRLPVGVTLGIDALLDGP
jgi:4-hydroxy-tetrahydrodipicolinate reductase